ncbi:hypothetical protein Bca52824_056971 [Brassica carinata]|uniref:Replication protein A 70 kDa DNA-binding subunit B/D first OB fold domain-containing protein n=1 Tax=Brassica carinata TaxID=52824 RepID=A0A8X7UFT5_BRACI|nr:hypothetical protein Bca52824_056971 [Brassica carinata]
MMTNAILNPVKTLKPYKTKWRSQVKLLHSWRQNTSFGGETLQMVLTDERGEKIHATCKRNHIQSVQRKLPSGNGVFSQRYRFPSIRPISPTTHPYKMTISDETVITNSDII